MSEKSTRVSGFACRPYVKARKPFHNSNKQLYAQWQTDDMYVVYSYGAHWPLFINWKGVWFENEDKTSRTTTAHHGKTHPHKPTVPLSCSAMKRLVSDGKPSPEVMTLAAELKLLGDTL